MPAGPRIRANNVFGSTTDNPLTAGAVTFNSPGLATLPVVSSAHAVVVLDPKRVNGEPEIVVITSHTAAATVATIVRGQYGTVARSHPLGTGWAHVPVDEDYIEILTSATQPSDPYRGQQIFQTDTNSFIARTTADTWANINMLADPPACRVFHSVNQSILHNTNTAVLFNSERYDTDSMHSTAALTTRITINTAGLYLVGANVDFAPDTDYFDLFLYLRIDGTTQIAFTRDVNPGTASLSRIMNINTVYKFAVAQYVEVIVLQSNTSTAANNIEAFASRSPEFWATWIGRG